MPIKKLEVSDIISSKDVKVNEDAVLQYVRVYQSNQRQGTSKVKTKSEVSGGGIKPHQQKKLGRARAGSIRSPLWRGGGIVHGPTPKDWSRNISKSLRRSAFKSALVNLIKNGVVLSDDFSKTFSKISTKTAASYLEENNINGRVLVITKEFNAVVYKSFRNMKYVEVRPVSSLSTYDLLLSNFVLIEKGSESSISNLMGDKAVESSSKEAK